MKKTIIKIMAFIALLIFCWMSATNEILVIEKDDWNCVKYEEQTNLMPMPIDNMIILQPMISTVCVEYRRR